jgi:hypothetical protein
MFEVRMTADSSYLVDANGSEHRAYANTFPEDADALSMWYKGSGKEHSFNWLRAIAAKRVVNRLFRGKPEQDTQILFGGMGRLTENCVLSIKNKSYAITAEIEVPESGAKAVIIAQGGSTNGWSLYVKDGKLKYCYNFFGIQKFFVEGTTAIPAGQHQVRLEFKYDGGGLAKGGNALLYVDGKKVGEGRVEQTVPLAFSADETCDVGRGTGTAVSPDYGPRGNEFNGEVKWVQIDLEKENHDHLISPEERFRVAMARQ